MKYSGYMICCDYDGTLATSSKTVSKANIDSINDFIKRGGIFTFATGRTPKYVSQYIKDVIPNAPIITVNGTALYDFKTGNTIKTIPLKHVEPELIKQICNNDGFESVRFVYEDYFEATYTTDDICNLKTDYLNNVLKLVFVFTNNKTPIKLSNELNKLYAGMYRFSRSWEYSLEMIDFNAGKGLMLNALKESVDRKINTVIGIGDFDNDITLVEYADIGIAVKNASEQLKQRADYITEYTNDDDAVAKIISKL